MSLIHSHANEPRFREASLSTTASDIIRATTIAAVERAYGPWQGIADSVERLDDWLGSHMRAAEWGDARPDAAADVDAVAALLATAELAVSEAWELARRSRA